MKNIFGHFLAICLIITLSFSSFCSCGKQNEITLSDDQSAMSQVMYRFYKEEHLVISDLKKIEADENTIYYKIEGTNTVLDEVLTISIVVEFDRQFSSIKFHYLNSAKDDDEVKTMWDNPENNIVSFTEDELSKLLEEAKEIATLMRESIDG